MDGQIDKQTDRWMDTHNTKSVCVCVGTQHMNSVGEIPNRTFASLS